MKYLPRIIDPVTTYHVQTKGFMSDLALFQITKNLYQHSSSLTVPKLLDLMYTYIWCMQTLMFKNVCFS